MKSKRQWPFLGWMSILEMQEHIKELRKEIERLDARLHRPKRAKKPKAEGEQRNE
jgi:uncharacterized small protein (DUF1192 family)